MIPENINFDIIDGFTKVTDKDAALYCRELIRKEAMLLGNSAGAAIKGVLQLGDNFNKDDEIYWVVGDTLYLNDDLYDPLEMSKTQLRTNIFYLWQRYTS